MSKSLLQHAKLCLLPPIARRTSDRSYCLAPSTRVRHDPREFTLKRALLVSKMTRYEYEKQIWKSDEHKLKKLLTVSGSDYDGLLARHKLHHERLAAAVDSLKGRGVDVEVVGRLNYTTDAIQWADAVFSAGGDGTFLLAASKIDDPHKAIVGVNTDPNRSEGHLCLSKSYSLNFDSALAKIMSGSFRWRYRQRLRVTMAGHHSNDDPMELHEQQLCPENRFLEHMQESDPAEHLGDVQALDDSPKHPPRVLPCRALNEVFIGESNSARVSYYELSIDGGSRAKQKSSGLTLSTGTGSSSWWLSINQLSCQDTATILGIANRCGNFHIPADDPGLINKITNTFNSSLHFDPEDPRMAFTIRDPINNGVFSVSQQRGFTNKVEVRSRMWDGCIVVDGGASFRCNNGAVATIQVLPEDALRTLSLD